jgi:hypothetical protein
MAMVFSEDVLFLHVPKTGGVSVAHYLLRSLRPPIHYVIPGHLRLADRPGYVHIPDTPHRNLQRARAFLRERGIELADFKAIIAVIRNPYDLAVSNYAYQRQERLRWTLIDAREAPAPTHRRKKRLGPEVETVLDALAANPGQVARIELAPGDAPRSVRGDLHRSASQRGQVITSWQHGGVLFVAPTARSDTRRVRGPDSRLDFKSYVLNGANPHEPSPLRQLYDFFHLDGVAPPNLRIVRFERLAEGIRDALQDIDTQADDDFPWLNRSDHGAYETYYDAETEAGVYAQARWIFDGGLYERLRVPASQSRESLSGNLDDTVRPVERKTSHDAVHVDR